MRYFCDGFLSLWVSAFRIIVSSAAQQGRKGAGTARLHLWGVFWGTEERVALIARSVELVYMYRGV
jgi:hypothetical protein